MLKKDIKYTDFNGQEVTETFYFHLSKAELVMLELKWQGGLAGHVQKLMDAKRGKEIVSVMNEIISESVGRRSEDGRRFEKSPEITNDFMQTGAHEVLFFELIENPGAAADFVKGIVPKEMGDRMEANGNVSVLGAIETATSSDEPSEEEMLALLEDADREKKLEDYTEAELLDMPTEQFRKLAGTDPRKMPKAVMRIAFRRKQLGKD